jgi:hypothetical protein
MSMAIKLEFVYRQQFLVNTETIRLAKSILMLGFGAVGWAS